MDDPAVAAAAAACGVLRSVLMLWTIASRLLAQILVRRGTIPVPIAGYYCCCCCSYCRCCCCYRYSCYCKHEWPHFPIQPLKLPIGKTVHLPIEASLSDPTRPPPAHPVLPISRQWNALHDPFASVGLGGRLQETPFTWHWRTGMGRDRDGTRELG